VHGLSCVWFLVAVEFNHKYPQMQDLSFLFCRLSKM
jgi:hypothetical protein